MLWFAACLPSLCFATMLTLNDTTPGNAAGAVGQQSGDATPGTQGSDAAEFMSDDASESQDTLSSMGIAVMAHRVPATIEWKGRDAFSMIIAKPDSDDDSEEEEHEESTAAAAAVAAGEEAQQIEVTSSDEEDGVEIDIQIVEASSQEASTPTAGSEVDVEAAKDGAKPAFSGRLDEIESIVRSAMGAAIAQGTGATASGGDEYGLTGRVEYTRLPTIDAPTDVFSGIYIGSFGPHGPEVLHVHRTMVDGEEWVYGELPIACMIFLLEGKKKRNIDYCLPLAAQCGPYITLNFNFCRQR